MTGRSLGALDQTPSSASARAVRDPYIFDMEMRDLLPSSWIFVCDIDEVASSGDYVTAFAGYEPVMVVGGEAGSIRAFINVCPHRGSIIVEGSGRCLKRLTCPYHGWSFTLDGQLQAMPYQDRWTGTLANQRLIEVRVGVWQRFVFVNVSGDAEPLGEQMAEWNEILSAYQLDAAKVGRRTLDRCHVNWKLFSDINLDSFHIPTVHATTIAKEFRVRDVHMREGANSASSIGVFPVREALIGATQRLKGLEEPYSGGATLLAHYPGFVLSMLPTGHFYITWWWPTDIATTTVAVMAYERTDHPELTEAAGTGHESDGASPSPEQQDPAALLKKVRHEDFQACARVQVGIRSGYFIPGPGHELELQATAFHNWLDEQYRNVGLWKEASVRSDD